MPIGDGCGWGASTKNIAGFGALKSLSNIVTGAVSIPVGSLAAATMYPFRDDAVDIGKRIANYPILDNDKTCYHNCAWNELESMDGQFCNGYDGEFYSKPREHLSRAYLGAKRSSKSNKHTKRSSKLSTKRSKKHAKRSNKSKKHAKRSAKRSMKW